MGVLCLVFYFVFRKAELLTYSCVISVHNTDKYERKGLHISVKNSSKTSRQYQKIIILGRISTF